MTRLWSRVQSYLSEGTEQPLTLRLRRTVQLGALYAKQVGAGRLFLRECDEVGEGTRVIGGRPGVENRGFISIGPRTVFICDMGKTTLRTGPAGRLTFGTKVITNFGSLVSANLSVRIGDYVSIGQYCLIADTEGADTAPDTECAPIEIGNNVWIAARVTVLPGVKIGEGSVITAGSIVSSQIPAGVVAGGIPARVLRKLQPGEEVGEPASRRFTRPQANGARMPSPPPAPLAVQRSGVIASDFTIGELASRLNSSADLPAVDFECGEFGQVVPTLLSPAPAGRDVLVVWTRPEAAVPGFANRLAFEVVEDAAILSEVDAFCDLVLRAADSYKTIFVATWVLATYQRGLGMIDDRAGGVHRVLTAMNLRLMERLESSPSVFVLNAQRWVETAGRAAHQPRLWYMGKVPFHGDVFAEAARDIKAALSGLSGAARKLLVLDLDDTLWGGIVGDAGWENLRLGGHDSVGEAFVDFQRAARDLKRRGIVLAIASKNEESVALEAMRSHPEMILRQTDFVAWRINWQDKALNIVELAAELNLGLQSVVFIDDSPVERARVREQLPEVLVPEWPEDKLLYASTLRALRCFDAPAVSREDATRTELYSAERERDTLRTSVGSLDEWLTSLKVEVHAARLNASNVARATQLLNKTNQLNLSTKRYTEAELLTWNAGPDRDLWAVSVSDRFGDAGLTGVISVEYADGVARVSDLVLSCRVIGRKIEETLVHLVVSAARRRRSIALVHASYVPTPKNKPCLDFLLRSGFQAEGNDFFWDTARDYPCPSVIQLKVGEN